MAVVADFHKLPPLISRRPSRHLAHIHPLEDIFYLGSRLLSCHEDATAVLRIWLRNETRKRWNA
jgi:hypothetical protein